MTKSSKEIEEEGLNANVLLLETYLLSASLHLSADVLMIAWPWTHKSIKT